jgi:hypothetical protein
MQAVIHLRTKGCPVTPDAGKLVDAIELRLAALDINSRQAAQTAEHQLREISSCGRETAAVFEEASHQADNAEKTLTWHVTMVRRILTQLAGKAS